jgi:dolichol-phosphate mannosyltransferase
VDHEIIFVNDGSPDDTDAVLQALAASDAHVLAIEHSRNFGSQSAFLSGMELASGDAVVLLDGDLQDPPEVIPAFYEKWREGHDVVYGRRSKREAPLLLTAAYKVFYKVFRWTADVAIPLDAGDFALMDRRVVDELLALPETDQFLRGLRAWVGFKQTGVDYLRPRRAFGRSTHGWLKNVWWARKGIFSFTFLPLEGLGYAGATLTLLSFLAVVYQLVDLYRRPAVGHGLALIGVLIAFFGSLNLLAVALVGEYLIKIFEETKRRPKFIRKTIRHGQRRLSRPAELAAFLEQRRAARRSEGDEGKDEG